MQTDKSSAVLAVIAAVAMAALYFTAGDDGTQKNYCEMRAIYKDSDGRCGWPAHDDAKEEGCK